MHLEHSPGPWFVTDENLWHTHADGPYIYTNGIGKELVAALECEPGTSSGHPDARLIAAAPDLLAACQIIADWLSTPSSGDGLAELQAIHVMEQQLQAAIAKATATCDCGAPAQSVTGATITLHTPLCSWTHTHTPHEVQP